MKSIINFRGVFMRNTLPKKMHLFESGIVNLDQYSGNGTHWVAYIRKGNVIKYFDSYGNLRPSSQIIILNQMDL